MPDLSERPNIDWTHIPAETVGIRLCKMNGENLVLCEPIYFTSGRAAVELVLRRASISGPVGPIGETGDYWGDLMDHYGNMTETISLSSKAWNSLKNRWMRCKIDYVKGE